MCNFIITTLTYILLISSYNMVILRSDKKDGGFVSLGIARHNMSIESVVYCNPKITKRLFFVGSVLPDMKISWLVLVVYLIVKYPLSIRVVVGVWFNSLRGRVVRGCYMFKVRWLK